MEKTFRSVAFWAAAIAATAFLLLVFVAAIWAYFYARFHPSAQGEEHAVSLIMTYGLLLIVAGFVFSCVFLGWGRDRREVNQLRRQLVDLNFKLSELTPSNDALTSSSG